MKKIITIIIGVILITGLLTGCDDKPKNISPVQNDSQPAPQQATPQSEQQPPAPVETPQAQPQDATTQQPTQNTVDTSGFIGEEKAKQIALDKAGITADGVLFDRVELDRDNGVWQYEIEFRKGFTEYDADVRATDGAILEYNKEYDD